MSKIHAEITSYIKNRFWKPLRMNQKSYTLLRDRFEHKAGTVVYACSKHDYGLARDDTNDTGEDHRSVSLKPDGDYPFFTVPYIHLRVIL